MPHQLAIWRGTVLMLESIGTSGRRLSSCAERTAGQIPTAARRGRIDRGLTHLDERYVFAITVKSRLLIRRFPTALACKPHGQTLGADETGPRRRRTTACSSSVGVLVYLLHRSLDPYMIAGSIHAGHHARAHRSQRLHSRLDPVGSHDLAWWRIHFPEGSQQLPAARMHLACITYDMCSKWARQYAEMPLLLESRATI